MLEPASLIWHLLLFTSSPSHLLCFLTVLHSGGDPKQTSERLPNKEEGNQEEKNSPKIETTKNK